MKAQTLLEGGQTNEQKKTNNEHKKNNCAAGRLCGGNGDGILGAGNTWIMKGFQQGLKPCCTYEQFVATGQSQFKKLPSGWTFRVKTLDKDLNEKPEYGVATMMPDEFFNIYDSTGPGMSNYKP